MVTAESEERRRARHSVVDMPELRITHQVHAFQATEANSKDTKLQ